MSPPRITVTAKAVKSDEASVPVHLWDEKIMELFPWLVERCQADESSAQKLQKTLYWLRGRCLRWWKTSVIRKFHEWFHGTEHVSDNQGDIETWGIRMIGQLKMASWWEWQGGSTPFFWR
mmetsp:Transcript_3704/g.5806  ORF Transcript_3704/g.5806 Transcript_3704/m.5806 type:complete len:120 (+) Transcript_3704:1434-1793(+)